MDTPATVKVLGTPPRWMNAVVRALLRVPGLNRILGRAFSVITVTGARTGTRYATPVQHLEVDGRYVVLSQRMRTWWRNLRTRPEVELLVQGRMVRGRGSIAADAEASELLARVVVIVIDPD